MAAINKGLLNISKRVKILCEPAMLYLIVSMMGLLMLGLQNSVSSPSNVFCMGKYHCNKVTKSNAFVLQTFYILFWTWLLNNLCKCGFINVSWVIVLFPFVMYFGIVLGLISSGIFMN